MAPGQCVPLHFSSCISPCRYRSSCPTCHSNCLDYDSSPLVRICEWKFELKAAFDAIATLPLPASWSIVQVCSVQVVSRTGSGSSSACRWCNALRPAVVRASIRRTRHSFRGCCERLPWLSQLCGIKLSSKNLLKRTISQDIPGRELTRFVENPEFK